MLLGFSAVCVSVLETEFKFKRFTYAQRADMYHCWRLIGWHLGILDEFNVCASVEEVEECLEDYLSWTTQRLGTCRNATHVLQRSVCDSFGQFTGVGSQWYRALVVLMQSTREWNVQYTKITCLPGLPGVVCGCTDTSWLEQQEQLVGWRTCLGVFFVCLLVCVCACVPVCVHRDGGGDGGDGG